MLFVSFALFASTALAGLRGSATCAADQASSWESVRDGEKDPAWPYTCSLLYTWEEGDTLESVLSLFSREAYEIFLWNCFLDWEVDIEVPAQICIEAELPPESRTLSRFTPPTLTASPTGTEKLLEARTTPTAEAAAVTQLDGRFMRRGDSPINSTSLWGGWNPFDKPCDAEGHGTTNCVATTACNTDLREYPVCEGGECVCKTIPCYDKVACGAYDICRRDEQEVACIPEPEMFPDLEGVCQCRPREVGCLLEGDRDRFCSEALNCTVEGFTPYVEYGQCVLRDGDRNTRGECACQVVECPYADGEGDDSVCEGSLACEEGSVPECHLKYFDEGTDPDAKGYCICNDELLMIAPSESGSSF